MFAISILEYVIYFVLAISKDLDIEIVAKKEIIEEIS